jgi:hypothetical protein
MNTTSGIITLLVADRYAGQDGTEFYLDHPYSNKHIKEEIVVKVGYLPEWERSRGDNDLSTRPYGVTSTIIFVTNLRA